MDWCPLPSHAKSPKDNMDYVAIGGFPDTAENCIVRDQLYPLGKQDAHPNMIQIWSMNCNTDDQGELQGNPETYLSLCILHSYGAVLDLKWCPTGGLMDAVSANGFDMLWKKGSPEEWITINQFTFGIAYFVFRTLRVEV